LSLIVILGFAIQIYRLSDTPPGFFADEAAIGLNAYTLLKNGTDEYGNRFPLFFKSFGDYKSPIAFYTTVPFVALLGLNEFAVRFTSVVFGLLNIIMIYLLVRQLLNKHPHNTAIALFSSLFLAISPWHTHMSRIGWEAFTQMLFLIMLGSYIFLLAQKKPRLLPASVFVFALALYCYFPARVFVPLFGLGLFLANAKFFWNHKRETLISIILLSVLLAPLAYHQLSPMGWSRWNMVSVFSHPSSDKSVLDHTVDNYLSHFSFNFLFRKGDIGMPGQSITRHSVRGLGELYLFQLPLIFIGAYVLWDSRYRKVFAIIALWLILYPLGSAFTISESAQATRSFVGVIPFQILSAAGLWALLDFMSQKKKLLYVISIFIVTGVILASVAHYLNAYFVKYPMYSSEFYGWQYGARDIVKYFISVESEYDDLIMAPDFNAPDIFISFYSQNFEKGCKKCIVGRFEKYNKEKRQLFAVRTYELEASQYNSSFVPINTIYHPNGNVAFLIGEIT